MKAFALLSLLALSATACRTTGDGASEAKDLASSGFQQRCGQPSQGLAACLTVVNGAETFQFWSANTPAALKNVTSIHPSASMPGYVAHDFQVYLNGFLADSSLLVSPFTLVDVTGEHAKARWIVRTTAGWITMPGTTDFELYTMSTQATPSDGPVPAVPQATISGSSSPVQTEGASVE